MRDPGRIPEMLQELAAYWQRYPDLRLGQIVSNLTPPTSNVYNFEDTALLEVLRRANAEGRPLAETDLHGKF